MNKKSQAVLAVLFAAGISFTGVAPGIAHAGAEDVASLYGPQPPAEAAYLRVLNASSAPVQLSFTGGGPAQRVAPHAVTRYSVLRPGEPLRVTIDGRAVGGLDGAAVAATGQYVTIAVDRDAKGWHARSIVARQDQLDGLKATLRAFNFAANCGASGATIGIAGAGATVFGGLADGSVQTRAINPVSASLVGQCGSASTAPLALPQLAAGDGYSLFVVGDAAKPVLVGARDAIAWPPAAH
jgi:alginate O-acetyltransferase complex protein AlgF